MGKASSQQSSEKAWVCCVLVSLHRGFNRVSIATRQNLTGENNNKHAAAQSNASDRLPTWGQELIQEVNHFGLYTHKIDETS